jgi:subtilisin family serine protease
MRLTPLVTTAQFLLSITTASIAFLPACGGDDGPDPTGLRKVMVIDDGFDPSVGVFQGKIAASFTIECDPPPPAPDGGAPADAGPPAGDGGAPPADARPSFEEERDSFLAALARPDERCRLRPGIAAKKNPFAAMDQRRGAWNETMRRDLVVGASLQDVAHALIAGVDEIEFHGTATAGVIAQANPDLRLVLIERSLLAPGEAEARFTCLVQEDIDRTVALLADPAVRQAYVGRPSASVDRQIADVVAAEGVQLVNESFGLLSRFSIEQLQREKGCKEISLNSYFVTVGGLDSAYEDLHPGAALVIKAGGNEGVHLTGLEDSLECRLNSPRLLSIGSYGPGTQRSKFSNFGPCVDAFAPGENVLAPIPGDWLLPLVGTSFSAPMVARLITVDGPHPFDRAAARAFVLRLRGLTQEIPVTRFPAELLYEPRTAGGQALTLHRAPTRIRMPSEWELHRWLWPIRLVERRRGR